MLHFFSQIGPPVLPPPPALPVIKDPADITAIFQGLVGNWIAAASPYAYELFWALAFLDVAVFGWNLWMTYHGDLEHALKATANKILIIGMFLALLMNGTTWMAAIINSFIQIGKEASGIPSLAPSAILLQGFKIFGVMFGAALTHGAWLDLPTAIALIVAGIFICAGFLFITAQFVITQVQVFLALGIGYVFLAFGGSRWTTPYVERYFAFAFASGIKLMTLYLLVGGGWSITAGWVDSASQIGLTTAGVEQAWAIACGGVLYAAVCWFASSQISAMLGGSPNLSHSDLAAFMGPMVSGAVAAGMIAAGVGSGGAATAAGAGASVAGKAAGSASSGSASTPGGATPPQPGGSSGGSPGGGGGSAASAAAGMAHAGASTLSRMPSGSAHTPPPHFSGFGH